MKNNLEVYKKSEIALKQLKKAIQLFYNENFICALTLAGASEEILGKIAHDKKRTNALEVTINFINNQFEKDKKGKLSKATLNYALNKTKNEIKHNDSGRDSYVAGYFKYDAEHFIERAIENYKMAFNEFPKDKIIMHFVKSHNIDKK